MCRHHGPSRIRPARGATEPTFAATNIAAATLGKMTLGTVNVSNGGTPFGLAAQSIQVLSATAGSAIRSSRLDDPSQSLDLTDFKVRVF